jgi:hypothetical protein
MEAVIEGYGLQPVHKEQNELWALAPEGMVPFKDSKMKRALTQIVASGFVSPLVMLLACKLGEQNPWVVFVPPLGVGFLCSEAVFGLDGHPHHATSYEWIVFAVYFAFIWFLLLAVLKLSEKFIIRKREIA